MWDNLSGETHSLVTFVKAQLNLSYRKEINQGAYRLSANFLDFWKLNSAKSTSSKFLFTHGKNTWQWIFYPISRPSAVLGAPSSLACQQCDSEVFCFVKQIFTSSLIFASCSVAHPYQEILYLGQVIFSIGCLLFFLYRDTDLYFQGLSERSQGRNF